MKKLFLALTLILLLIIPTTVFSAGSVTESWKSLGDGSLRELTLTVTASFTGAVTDYDVEQNIDGCLYYAVTNPGAKAPTDNYDITFIDSDSVDQAGGELANRDTANTETVKFATVVCMTGIGTLTVSNNTNNSAVTVIKLFFGR